MTKKAQLAAAIQAARWSELSDALAAAAERFGDAGITGCIGFYECGYLKCQADRAEEDLRRASEVASDLADRLGDE